MSYRALEKQSGGRLTDVEKRVYFLSFAQTWCRPRAATARAHYIILVHAIALYQFTTSNQSHDGGPAAPSVHCFIMATKYCSHAASAWFRPAHRHRRRRGVGRGRSLRSAHYI